MTTKIGGIVIDVDARLTKLEASLKKADRDFNRFERNTTASGRRIESGIGGINKSFGKLGGVIAGAAIGFGIEGLYRLGRTALETADDLGTAADRAGVGVERFQTLREVFRIAEVDAAKFDKALARLSGTLGDVQRGVQDEATKALEQMGITSRILSGEITTTDGLLDAIADSAKNFGSEAQFTSAAVDIFGQKLGVELAPALAQGTAAINEAEQAVRDAGMVIDEFSVNQLADANEAIDRFTARTKVEFTNWAGSIVNDIQFLSDETAAYMDMLANARIGDFLTTSAVNAAQIGKNMRGAGTPLPGMGEGASVFFGALNAVQNASRPKIARLEKAGGKKSGGRGGSAKGGLSDAQKLTQEFEKQVQSNARLLQITELRENGQAIAAETQERMWELADKFPKLEAGRLEILKKQIQQLEKQSVFYKEIDDMRKRWENSPLTNALEADDVTKQLDALIAKNGFSAEKLKAQNVKIAKSFQDMANDTVSAVNQMANAITGGGFLDIFSAFVSLGLQLGSIGAFGKKIQTNINSVPGKATGGYSPGGMTMVGEYGPEMVNLPRGSHVVPNHRLGGGGGQALHFDLRGAVMTQDLLDQMNQIGAVSAVAGGNMGKTGALNSLARSQSRALT